MYNRYIPQPDGTYRRSRIEEPIRQPERRPSPPKAPPPPPPPVEKDCKREEHKPSHRPPPSKQEISIGSFFRNILPAGLDTGDLLVIVLLLLMAGDCAEDQNTAMLTLAMYLFM